MSDSLRPHGLQPARFLSSQGFSRQEYQSGLPYPPPGDLPNPGIEPRSPILQVDSLPSEPSSVDEQMPESCALESEIQPCFPYGFLGCLTVTTL